MIKAIYPGTFDPLTRGHEELVRRASTLFDTLVLAIAESTPKRTFFSLQERIDMAREVLADVKNLEVTGFSGLLTDFVRKHKARVVLRGLRAVSDFEYEFQLAGMNRNLYPQMETIFLTPSVVYTDEEADSLMRRERGRLLESKEKIDSVLPPPPVPLREP